MKLDPEVLRSTRHSYLAWMRKEWDFNSLASSGPAWLFRYAAWGSAIGGSLPVEEWLATLQAGGKKGVPRMRARCWADIEALDEYVRASTVGYRLMPWLLMPVGHWERNWRLRQVHMIGPKISAWILRDVSFLMDYRPSLERNRIKLGSGIDDSWFLHLPSWAQAYYLPIDRWVHRACVDHGVYSEDALGGFNAIQQSSAKHEKAATMLAEWCGKRSLDPRHVNTHWYWEGSKGA